MNWDLLHNMWSVQQKGSLDVWLTHKKGSNLVPYSLNIQPLR